MILLVLRFLALYTFADWPSPRVERISHLRFPVLVKMEHFLIEWLDI